MSLAALVDYDESSDEESEPIVKLSPKLETKNVQLKKNKLSLPKPKATAGIPGTSIQNLNISDNEDDLISAPTSFKLPTPKMSSTILGQTIEEDDDEFLHKKVTAPEKPPPPPKAIEPRKTVKITIPSMAQFSDVDITKKGPMIGAQAPEKPTGLLNLLPKPKMDTLFSPKNNTAGPSTTPVKHFVPHSVANKKKAVPKKIEKVKKKKPAATVVAHYSDDSDGSDHEGSGDFFSLNSKVKLPEVSVSEINAMVAQQNAKMAKASAQFKLQSALAAAYEQDNVAEEFNTPRTSSSIDARAIQALVGSRAKRARLEDMQVIDLSSDQILPNQDEWLRTAVQSTTEYIPRGMVNEEATPGTRRKHQITYLAHMAKTNEQELQAMWAANRHTKRQTQSKYGF